MDANEINQRIVALARRCVAIYSVRFELVKNDPTERTHADELSENIIRVNRLAQTWEENPITHLV